MQTERYDQWFAEEGINNETEDGNLKTLPGKQIVEWILESWKSIPTESIKWSFKSCALNINFDGSEDNIIHCFKESQPFIAGIRILKSQMEVSRDLEDEANPFKRLKRWKRVETIFLSWTRTRVMMSLAYWYRRNLKGHFIMLLIYLLYCFYVLWLCWRKFLWIMKIQIFHKCPSQISAPLEKVPHPKKNKKILNKCPGCLFKHLRHLYFYRS